MFAAESYTSRHYIAIVAMAFLCVLLGGPSYAAGAESLIIAGATYYEPGASGPGWAWTDADHLELNGYAGEAFVDVMPAGSHPETRSVRASNLCRIAVHRPQGGDTLVVLSVIDNLVKGAAGQAVQNLNIMFGFDEEAGLDIVPVSP